MSTGSRMALSWISTWTPSMQGADFSPLLGALGQSARCSCSKCSGASSRTRKLSGSMAGSDSSRTFGLALYSSRSRAAASALDS